MPADRDLGRRDQRRGQLRADLVDAVVDQLGETSRHSTGKGLRVRILGQQRARQHAVQALDVAGELGEAEIDQAMELTDTVAEVGDQAVTMADQFAQFVGGGIRQPGRGRPLLGAETGNAQRVDGVGLGALQIFAGEAPGPQRIEQRHRVAVRRQRGEQVAPVMSGRLHRHQGDRRLAEQGEQLGIARRILGNPGGFDGHRAIGGHRRHDVTVRSDIDTDIAHADPDLLIRRGASPQTSMLTLVHARTTVEAAPPDTVRARDAGRGRRSHSRGCCLNPFPTTLSQLSFDRQCREAVR